MRRRRLLGAVALLAVVLVGVGSFVLRPQSDRITKENFDRIAQAMTRQEIYAILGQPGDYSTGPICGGDPSTLLSRNFEYRSYSMKMNRESWVADTGWLVVLFDPMGYPRRVVFCPQTRVKQSPFDNLVWRAKRAWRNWFAV
jgi:hypothetical protein